MSTTSSGVPSSSAPSSQRALSFFLIDRTLLTQESNSHFDEVFKLPKVRNWMQWDDSRGLFLNEANRKSFYALITGEESEGQRLPPWLSDAKNVRDLGELMEDPIRFKQFLETPTVSLQDALRGVISPERKLDWRGGIAQVLTLMRQQPTAA